MSDTEKTYSLTCQFSDVIALYRAYMSFVEKGAVFVASDREDVHLGDKVNVTMTLPKAKRELTFSGTIIWITPKKLLSEEATTGVGVQLQSENAREVREQIEEILKDYLNSDQHTDTM